MLKAIEEEHFDQLPGGVFNKGFIRAYARHLGLDGEEAVNEYLAWLRQAQVDANTVPGPQRVQERRVPAVAAAPVVAPPAPKIAAAETKIEAKAADISVSAPAISSEPAVISAPASPSIRANMQRSIIEKTDSQPTAEAADSAPIRIVPANSETEAPKFQPP